MNDQTKWRVEFAKDLVSKLQSKDGLAGIFIGGSVSRGFADEYSDLELCFIWHKPPTDDSRKSIINQFNGKLFSEFHSWTEDTHALEDDIYVDGFQVDMWHNTIANDEKDIEAVLTNYSTKLSHLNFADTIKYCIPLYEVNDIISNWKKRVSTYPISLQKKLVEENIAVFSSNNTNIHLHRKDLTIFYGLIAGYQKRITMVLLGLNEMYFPTYKRLSLTLKKMKLKPKNINDLFEKSYSVSPEEAWKITDNIMRETLNLVRNTIPEIDLEKAFKRLNDERRKQSDKPDPTI